MLFKILDFRNANAQKCVIGGSVEISNATVKVTDQQSGSGLGEIRTLASEEIRLAV